MKYRINVGYSIVVDAENEDMAVDEALATISADPHLHINLGIRDEKDIPYPPASYNASESISFYLELTENGIDIEQAEIILKRIEGIEPDKDIVKIIKNNVIAEIKKLIEILKRRMNDENN